MDVFGNILRMISANNTEITYLASIIDKKLEDSARKGKYSYTLVQPKKFFVDEHYEKTLDSEVLAHFKELQDYYKRQDINLVYKVNAFQPKWVDGEFVFSWEE